MCPKFKDGICEMAGIEPERIACIGKDECLRKDWEWCKVYIAQFFV